MCGTRIGRTATIVASSPLTLLLAATPTQARTAARAQPVGQVSVGRAESFDLSHSTWVTRRPLAGAAVSTLTS